MSIVAAPAAPALRPYMAFAWSPLAPMRHVYRFLWMGQAESQPGVAAKESQRMPDGCHVLFFPGQPGPVLHDPRDFCRTTFGGATDQPGVWPENGVREAAARMEAFFDGFARAGGKCDLVVLDFEDNLSNWAMTPERLAAIEKDPRFPALARELGFSDLGSIANLGNGRYLKWNAVTGAIVNDALDRAVAAPLKSCFPAAGMSNFGSVVMTPENVVPDLNGHAQYTQGKQAGTWQSPVIYGGVGQLPLRMPEVDWKAPLTDVIYMTNNVRSAVRCSPAPVLPWVAFRSYKGDGPGRPVVTFGGTDYWQESVYHGLLSGASSDVLFFDPVVPHPAGTTPPGSTTPQDVEAMEDLMADLEKQAGGSPLARSLTTTPIDYKARAVVSAARTASGRALARVTFAEGLNTAQVEIEGRTYHATRPPGKVGTWIEVP